MLIKALCDYYDLLASQGKVNKDGYSTVGLSYLVALTPDGQIADIIDIRIKKEIPAKKDTVKIVYNPLPVALPLRTQKPGIDLNIIEHRSLYIFGLNYDKSTGTFTPNDATNKAKKSHEMFVSGNLAFIENLSSPIIDAYRNFLSNWKPEDETENPCLTALGNAYSGAYYGFCLDGRPDIRLNEDKQLLEKWESGLSQQTETDAICAITGESCKTAKTHNKLKGLMGGQASGCVLVGCNNDSECSYNKEQGYNSGISEAAMKKYTEAFNYLTSSRTHKTLIDDTTVIFFALSDKDDEYSDLFCEEAFGLGIDRDDTEKGLKRILEDARLAVLNGQKLSFPAEIDDDVRFIIAGLKPNSSRVSVKFIYNTKFGTLLKNMAQHSADISILGMTKTPNIYQIKRELISPKSKNEKVDPAMAAKLMQAIINGYTYPSSLLATVIRRVKTDSDEENNSFIKLNSTRAGIIKACVNRKERLEGKKEELTLALDKQNTNAAYLCGRLFALLEKAQQDASSGPLNRTIKDAYFSSACSTPAVILTKLLKLGQYHISKGKYGYYWQGQIGEVMSLLGGELPQTLSLTDQGKFIIGYYHQFYYKENTNKGE